MLERTDRLLPTSARGLLSDERAILGRLRELLASQGAAEDDLALLRQAELDLDELFLLVIVGEFNAGKSAFVNALLGERVLPEGVTPTTAVITRVRYAATYVEQRDGALLEVGYPLELLRDVAIVDTPGTNAILREHEEITNRFVPRADLVLFVTSADRPFTETERAFMERIRTWGKKIVLVLNKADLLSGEPELAAQLSFVSTSVERLLGFRPEIFAVSARLALGARDESDADQRQALWQRSRFERLERFVAETLDQTSRLQLKLSTPLGVAERVARTYAMAAEEKLASLADDLALSSSIETQLSFYREDMQRDVQPRLGQIDTILLEMEDRGVEYLDETLRLNHVVDLFRQQRLREEFERVVVADTPGRVDRVAQELIDWMVDQDLKLWKAITEQVDRRRRASTTAGTSERLTGSFEYDRRALLGSLGQTAHQVVERYDHRREAALLASSVRDSVTQATLLGAGAIGLGAVSLAIVGSAAADVTGLFAATVLAGLGLWVLPRKRRQSRAQFRQRTEDLRVRLGTALRDEFERELNRSVQRIKDALAPYDRLVRGEQERTLQLQANLQRSLADLVSLRRAIGELE
ncbi:MAG: dynamin family protein [Chloroflexi bacterium]|nr:dynamin family protein [Chloroflexota bacterium]